MQERLQKLMSQAGVASRRKAEEMILSGRVAVNGQIVSTLGAKADWNTDRVTLDSKPLRPASTLHYLLLYKPKGVVTTLSDPEQRPTIAAFTRGIRERLYPAGRLDYHSEGLLLLTNDGELANRVLHASTELPKTYWAKVSGRPTEEQLERLRRGVYLDGRRTAPARIRWLDAGARGEEGPVSRPSGRERRRAGVYRTSKENPWLEIVLIEGRYHQIRKMFQSIGHPVEKLKRVAIGRLTIGALKPGQMRPLSAVEVAQLQQAASRASKPQRTGALGAAQPQRTGALGAPGNAPQRRFRATRLGQRRPGAGSPAGRRRSPRRRERE